jgi:hypothetical protein
MRPNTTKWNQWSAKQRTHGIEVVERKTKRKRGNAEIQPDITKTWWLGKYKGVAVNDVPTEYLSWVKRKLPRDSAAVTVAVWELHRRTKECKK